MIAGGATLIQLREKNLPTREFFEAAKEAVAVARASNVLIIINDRVDIALAVVADGVHVGQSDIPLAAARLILGPDAIIGFSTNLPEQAIAAASMPVDYIAVGPIFATRTKQDPDPVTGLNGLRTVREVTGSIPLVAIGGLEVANLPDVFAAGADSAAVIGAVLRDPPRIKQQMQELIDLTSR